MHDIGIALQPACGASSIPEPPRKIWLMKRNCSLSPRQVGWFYLSIVILSFVIASFFAWQGAWFVLPFSGLEVAALGWPCCTMPGTPPITSASSWMTMRW